MTEAANKKFQKELNAGTSALILLGVLGSSTEPLYGYQIAKQIEESAQGTVLMKQGSLYPVLRSLEKTGLLVSEVEPSLSGPPRRYYRITEDGRNKLGEWTAIWEQSKSFVDRVLQGNYRV